MSLLKCPKCGEMFSDSYKTCPFCQEDEEFYSGKKPKNPGRRVERHKSPSILGPAMVLIVLLLVGFLTVTFLGDTVRSWFDRPAQEQPVDPDDKEPDDKEPDDKNPVTLTLSQSAVTLEVGGTASLTATGAENVTWTSSDEAVATVDAAGKVTAVASGTATITAAAEGATSAACEITVKAPAPAKDLKIVDENGVDLYPGEFSLGVGKTIDLKVDGTDSTVTWAITNGPEYASIDQDGVVKGLKAGVATLSATVDGQTLTYKVRVS